LGVVVRVAEPSTSWLPLRGYCQRLSLLPSFRLLRGVVERDPIGLNSTLDPEDWLVGLECGWGLACFDLVGTVSSMPSSTSTQDSTSIWYDVTGLLQCCFKWGCWHVGKALYPIHIVCQFLLYFPFINLIKSKCTYTGMLIWWLCCHKELLFYGQFLWVPVGSLMQEFEKKMLV
jgi:hypothetical protein